MDMMGRIYMLITSGSLKVNLNAQGIRENFNLLL